MSECDYSKESIWYEQASQFKKVSKIVQQYTYTYLTEARKAFLLTRLSQ